MRNLVILRGVSGSGKSTVAELWPSAIVCCADDYHMVDGEYKFDAKNLGRAHEACREKCEDAMFWKDELIVIANTNTQPKEFAAYEELAQKYGYKIFHLVVENRHGGTDIHGVPPEVLERQEQNLRNNLEL